MKFNTSLIALFLSLESFFFVINAQDTQQQTTQSETNTQAVTTQPATQTQTQEDKTAQVQTQTTSLRNKPFPEDLNIPDQFGYAIDKSSNFQDYKVIKQAWMNKLKSNVLDSIITLKSNLYTAEKLVVEKNKSIESQNTDLKALQEELARKNSLSFFGIMVSKSVYDTIMWSIIIGLLVAIGFLFAAFRRSYSVTVQTKRDLNDIKDEFENFRKKALKSKEEAVRQLYDELNKYKNKK
jgi:hypothetical protein